MSETVKSTPEVSPEIKLTDVESMYYSIQNARRSIDSMTPALEGKPLFIKSKNGSEYWFRVRTDSVQIHKKGADGKYSADDYITISGVKQIPSPDKVMALSQPPRTLTLTLSLTEGGETKRIAGVSCIKDACVGSGTELIKSKISVLLDGMVGGEADRIQSQAQQKIDLEAKEREAEWKATTEKIKNF